jgi:large subunit ribosomal protein L18
MNKIKIIPFKRRRLGLTDYKKRISLLKSEQTRFVIRKTNSSLICQAIDFDVKGDKVLLNINSRKLKEYGWNHSFSNVPAAYLSGFLFAKECMKAKVNHLIVDIGRNAITPGNKVFACLNGAVDAGLDIPHNNKLFPTKERINGTLIANYAKEQGKKSSEKITEDFEKVLKKLQAL